LKKTAKKNLAIPGRKNKMAVKKIYGWTGKILKIDLTTGKTSLIPTMDYAERFIGGRGINAKLHYDEVAAHVGAFDPENKLTIMTGPLDGTIAPTSGRVEVGGKSPQTYPNESYTVSSFGGWWGPELKYAGFDGLIVHGKSPKPVYLYIRDGKTELRDATHLWGKDIFTTQEMLWKELGDGRKPQILTIGPAGENLIRFAIMMHGSSSASGQGGFGGVCGSKNLKAIVVRGTGYVEVARPKELMDVAYEMNRWIYRPDQRPEKWTNIASFHRIGWSFFQGQKAKGWKWLKNYTRKAEACHACPLACRVFSNIKDSDGRQGSAKCNQFWYEKYDMERHKDITEVFYKAAKVADALGINGFEMIGMIP
jgi:aldehyde:ferredoxin oxidoreductase